MTLIPLAMFAVVFAVLLAGYPVALTLAGVSLLFAIAGVITGTFNLSDLGFLPGRLFGIVTNPTLIAVPLFILMGVLLEKSRIAENLLLGLQQRMGGLPGGLAVAVVLVGALLAASTGIVGATVVMMGLLSLPSMLQQKYDASFATGTIAATGTLGQIIPPSIALVLLGDVLSNAYQQAQLNQGIFTPKTVSVGDLFAGALVPGLLLVGLYLAYVIGRAALSPTVAPKASTAARAVESATDAAGQSISVPPPAPTGSLLSALLAPVALILAVLGSILLGIATPTEAAGVGAVGALLLALISGKLDLKVLRDAGDYTLKTTAMVFFILIGASVFSLIFRAYGGDELVAVGFEALPGGMWTALGIVMLVIFLLGFILDFIEITFVVVPIVGPVLLAMGIDPIWLGVLIALNLQTSFLTPPFGFALFYLRGVAPPEIATTDIYRGVVPFIALQLLLIGLLCVWPDLVTWLPGLLYK